MLRSTQYQYDAGFLMPPDLSAAAGIDEVRPARYDAPEAAFSAAASNSHTHGHSMIISHSRRFIFVHIHKAGGTSVEQALDPHLAWNDLILGGSQFGERIQGPYSTRFRLNKHSTASEIEAVCGGHYLDDYFVFSIVRDPFDRLCSIYNFVGTKLNACATKKNVPLRELPARMTPKDIKQTPALGWTSSRVFLQTKDFSAFIRHKDIGSAPGFRTQISSLTRASGAIAGTFFRLEDHPSWEARLSQQLGFDFHLPHSNKSKLRLVNARTASAHDRQYIQNLFAEDYEAFGYARDA